MKQSKFNYSWIEAEIVWFWETVPCVLRGQFMRSAIFQLMDTVMDYCLGLLCRQFWCKNFYTIGYLRTPALLLVSHPTLTEKKPSLEIKCLSRFLKWPSSTYFTLSLETVAMISNFLLTVRTSVIENVGMGGKKIMLSRIPLISA